MNNKIFLVLLFLIVGLTNLTAAELSGTYNKDYTVKTEFNTVSAGKTLRVTNGATFIMTDAIVNGTIIVEKGSSLIAAKDGAGYMVLSRGTHVEGIDLYYKVRVSDNLVLTRKIPMTLDEVWKSGNEQLIEWVSNIEYCYSTSLKGWISTNEIRFMNPFNENLYDEYDMIFTQSVSRVIENECRSLIVKNKSKVVIMPNQNVWSTKINESIIVEPGSSLVGTGTDEHKLQLKQGIKIQGLPLYVLFNNEPISTETFLADLLKQPDFTKSDYLIIYYNPELQGWVFDERLYGNNITDELKKKIEKLKKKS